METLGAACKLLLLFGIAAAEASMSGISTPFAVVKTPFNGGGALGGIVFVCGTPVSAASFIALS